VVIWLAGEWLTDIQQSTAPHYRQFLLIYAWNEWKRAVTSSPTSATDADVSTFCNMS